MHQVTAEATVITKTTAPDIPKAVSVFFETPRNGQHPRNLLSTKLLTKTALIKIIKYFMLLSCLVPGAGLEPARQKLSKGF